MVYLLTTDDILGNAGLKDVTKIRHSHRFVAVVIQILIPFVLIPPFSWIRDFGKQNTSGNVSNISVSLACY